MLKLVFGRWNKRRSHNIYVPAQGPSVDRLRAHQAEQQQKRLDAANARLELGSREDSDTGHNSDSSSSSSSSASESVSTNHSNSSNSIVPGTNLHH